MIFGISSKPATISSEGITLGASDKLGSNAVYMDVCLTILVP